MVGKQHCWIVRACGGKHEYRRVTKMVDMPRGIIPSTTREYLRCGHTIPVRSRILAPKQEPLK